MLGNIVYTPAPAAAVATSLTIGTTPIVGGTAGAVLFESTLNKVSENAGLNYTAGGVLKIKSTTEQLRILYDNATYLSCTIGSTGIAAITLIGTNAKFNLLNNVGIGPTTFTTTSTANLSIGRFTSSAISLEVWGNSGPSIIFQVSTFIATAVFTVKADTTTLISGPTSIRGAVVVPGVGLGVVSGGNIYPSINVYGVAGQTASIAEFKNSTGTVLSEISASGKIGFGTAGVVTAPFHAISTTEQLRIGYDSTHFASFTCNSTGALTITLTGTALSTFFTDKVVLGNTITLAPYTFATLPAAPLAGQKAYIIDALAPVYLAPAVGGGLIFCPVFYNGVNWVTC